jgi:hypothetical protein
MQSRRDCSVENKKKHRDLKTGAVWVYVSVEIVKVNPENNVKSGAK